jgi:signal transduction histidine kinase
MSVFPGVDKQTDRRVDADECVMNVTSAALPQVLETALVQYELLAFLSARGPLTTAELADRWARGGAMSDRNGLADTLDALVAAGLVDVVGDQQARQSAVAYRCTAEATRLVEQWRTSRWGDAPGAAPRDEEWAALARERETVERLRTDLLSTVSHELRTPLTLIRTSIGLLLDSQPDEAMRSRLLRNIKQSTDRMNALVTDLLDLVRLRHERVELQMRRIDVRDLLSGVATLIRPLLEDREQQLVIEMPRPAPRIVGDYRRLERLFLNLVSNANKFAPTSSSIRITVAATPETVTITVADAGPGIPPEVLPHLFEQFYTARTSSSSHNIGVGLGLPIAKSIAEAHGGEISVESEVGRGSAFQVRLPREMRPRKGVE